jgi:hypothetical protein
VEDVPDHAASSISTERATVIAPDVGSMGARS